MMANDHIVLGNQTIELVALRYGDDVQMNTSTPTVRHITTMQWVKELLWWYNVLTWVTIAKTRVRICYAAT
jgi:hypothetical protein